jgi:sarcosine oxidase subunit beta
METADVVVIGAGANGTSTAFHLAKAGVKRVVVVERQYLGSGATGKSGALVRMHYTNEPEVRLAEDQPEVFSALEGTGGWGLRFSAAWPARLYPT